jgi:outer membrane protein TolC
MTLRKILFLIICISNFVFAQYNLNYFINKALNNSPVIKDYGNLFLINNLQNKLDEAQNSAFQVYLSSNVLFSPYFNNHGTLFTPNPDSKAIGYDAAVTNGGLYSAQINLDKNIFNGGLLDALKEQRAVQGKSYENKTTMEKHDLRKQITDQYLNTLQYLMLYKLSKEVENNLSDQLKITSDLVSKGYAKAQDFLLLKIELKTRQIDLEQTWQNYKSGLAQLYSVCGIKDTQTVKIDSVNLTLAREEPSSNFLTQYYLDSLNTANQQRVFETKYQPQLDLFFNAGLNAVELNDIQRKFGVSAGINFSLPILDGNQKDITRQQTYIAQQTLSEYKNYLTENIFTKRRDAENRVKSLRKNLNDLNTQISDYKNLLSISENQLQQGNLSMIEYLTLMKNYIDLQKTDITTEINYQMEISNYNYWNW